MLEALVPDSAARPGIHKLSTFCIKARKYGCQFAWSDTCCINKESSAELDESIRSMFRWYHNALICIVYFGSSVTADDVAADEWFTRGWTLQELLAPVNVKFFNKNWHPLTDAENDKDRRNYMLPDAEKNPIWKTIVSVTQIPDTRLGFFSPGAFDVAQRMSWAAGRRTTRIEDMAYALVGIFGVTMPVQYGEGQYAFHRLLEVLLRRVNEYSILAWAGPPSLYSAALPASLEGYRAAQSTMCSTSVPNKFGDPAMMLTHKGLQVEVLLVPMQFIAEQSDEEDDTESADEVHSLREDEKTPSEVDETGVDSDIEADAIKLSPRFLGNDREYSGGGVGFDLINLTDEDGIVNPLRVYGRGPIIPRGELSFNETTYQYALAILDYRRDWERGVGFVFVPYEENSTGRYLAFVLFRDDASEVWSKLETQEVVYVEFQVEKRYEGQTVHLCL